MNNITSWNINSRSRGNTPIPDLVAARFSPEETPIVVLSEFVKTRASKFSSDMAARGYVNFIDQEAAPNANSIYIGLAKSFIGERNVDSFTLPKTDGQYEPNFFRVRVGKLNVVGTRITVGADPQALKEDFQDRAKQLLAIRDYIQQVSGPIILAADLNCGFYKQSDTELSFSGKPREYYSYPYVKNRLKEIELVPADPVSGSSWRGFRPDHVFLRDVTSQQANYDWSFTDSPDYKRAVGFPDHAILTVAVNEFGGVLDA